MTPREERGLTVAALCKLNRSNDGTWLVPSQSSEQIYRVKCPDEDGIETRIRLANPARIPNPPR